MVVLTYNNYDERVSYVTYIHVMIVFYLPLFSKHGPWMTNKGEELELSLSTSKRTPMEMRVTWFIECLVGWLIEYCLVTYFVWHVFVLIFLFVLCVVMLIPWWDMLLHHVHQSALSVASSLSAVPLYSCKNWYVSCRSLKLMSLFQDQIFTSICLWWFILSVETKLKMFNTIMYLVVNLSSVIAEIQAVSHYR